MWPIIIALVIRHYHDKPETTIGRFIIHTQNSMAASLIDGPVSAIPRNTFLLGTERTA